MSQTNFQTETIDRFNNPADWKKMKLNLIRGYHTSLIKDLGISPMDFNMKMPFYDKNGRYVVGLFSSEFKKDKGFFFELVTRDLDPLDPERKVYRMPRNDNFEEEYEMTEKGSFLVPVEELRLVNAQSVAISKESAVLSNDKLFAKEHNQAPVLSSKPESVFTSKPGVPQQQDALYSEMTIRDYMAIHTGKPVSLKPWLNDLLTTQQKLPF